MIIAGFEAVGKGRMSVGGRKEIDESFDFSILQDINSLSQGRIIK